MPRLTRLKAKWYQHLLTSLNPILGWGGIWKKKQKRNEELQQQSTRRKKHKLPPKNANHSHHVRTWPASATHISERSELVTMIMIYDFSSLLGGGENGMGTCWEGVGAKK